MRNNLITLDPLFLFGTNEIIDRERCDTTATTWRIGGRFRRRLGAGTWQYAFSTGGLPRTSDKTTIANFRTRTTDETTDEQRTLNLHRAELTVHRPAPSGRWLFAVRLTFPDVRLRQAEPPTTTPAPGPVGPAPAPAAKPEERVRGGWQITIGRELSW